jgi:hypothetical protein
MPLELQRPKVLRRILQVAPSGRGPPATQVPAPSQRDFLMQVVAPRPQGRPLRMKRQLRLQQEAPLKREMMRPRTKRTPGSHCSVPSRTPLPQLPGMSGVSVGVTEGGGREPLAVGVRP